MEKFTLRVITALLCLSSVAFGGPIPSPKVLVSRRSDPSDIYANWPSYDDLPLHPSFPTKAAWGVWGADDQFGALNHITNATIKASREEITEGIAISMNLALSVPNPPLNPMRPALIHALIPFTGYTDDIVSMNTQISTQFDGLRHYPYSDANFSIESYQFYNDLLTFEELMSPGGITTLGIQNSANKGIAGRAVLLDWVAWMESKGESFDAFSSVKITADELDQVAAWQGFNSSTFFKPGDFLILRTGFTKQYTASSLHDQSVLPFRTDSNDRFDMEFVGMEPSDATLRWLWDRKLSIVGSDNPTFESAPLGGTINGTTRSLHEVFIGGWGQSIVEYLDLETLAPLCHSLKKYSFFFSIQNLNVPGGIASPPNALAIL